MTADRSAHEPDDLEAYVLGTLSREEAAAFEERLAASTELQEAVRRARAVTWLLADSSPSLAPSPDLKNRIMDVVRAEQNGRGTAPVPLAVLPAPVGRPSVVRPPTRLPTRFPWTTWLAAAAVLLAIGLGGWNALLQQQLNQQQARLATQQAQLGAQSAMIAQQQAELSRDHIALRTLAAADRVWQMRGEPSHAPEATSMLAVNQDQKQTVLIVRGFPQLPEGRVYQVWVVINGRPLPVDTFAPTSTDSEQTLVVPTDLSGVTSAAITVEPAPGSQQPTGAIVMGGDL